MKSALEKPSFSIRWVCSKSVVNEYRFKNENIKKLFIIRKNKKKYFFFVVLIFKSYNNEKTIDFNLVFYHGYNKLCSKLVWMVTMATIKLLRRNLDTPSFAPIYHSRKTKSSGRSTQQLPTRHFGEYTLNQRSQRFNHLSLGNTCGKND